MSKLKIHFFQTFHLNFGPLFFTKSAWSKILLNVFHYGLLQTCPDKKFYSDLSKNVCSIDLRFCSKLLFWSKVFLKIVIMVHCGFKILHKIVILEHCGHKSFPVIAHVTLTGKRVTPRHSKNWGSTGAAKTQAPGVYSIWQYKIPSKFVLFCFITHSSYKFSSFQKQTNKQTRRYNYMAHPPC